MLLTRDILRESPLWQEIERDAKAEGEARGEQNGERRAVRLLLETRFGTLPQWVENQLAGADTDALDRWVKRAVSAPSLDSVFD